MFMGDANVFFGDEPGGHDRSQDQRPQDQNLGRDSEFASPGHREEIRRVIADLYARLPVYRKHLGSVRYSLLHTNLEVLSSCFYTNALNATALEVLHAHLLTLRRFADESG